MRSLLVALVVASGPVVAGPKIDEAAMREAMAEPMEEGHVASSSAYAHFLRARLAHHQGDHRRSVNELRLALATDESSPFLTTALAEEYARLSELGRAERELKRAIESAPRYFPAQLLMGRILLEGQKYTRARLHLRKAISLRPQDPDGHLMLTQLWLELGKVDQAMAAIEQMGEAIPDEAVGFKRLGLALAERHDHARAEKLLKAALDRAPGDFETLVGLARIYEATDRIEEAERSYALALEREPDSLEVLTTLGRLSLKRGSVSSAKAFYDRILSLNEDPEMVVKVAFSYLAHRQPAAAADVLDGSRAARGREPRLSFYAGLVHEKLRNDREAAKAYEEVGADSELFHESRLHRATCLSRLGDHDRAFSLFRAALTDRPDYLLLYPAYARALERAGKMNEAERFLLGAVKERPAAELFEALAAQYQRQGRFSEAVQLLVGAVSQRPNDEALLYILGAAYERKGEYQKSIDQMRAVLALNPDNSAALNFIGYTLAERGLDLLEAERLLRRALELKPDSGAYLDSLGWIYYQRGELSRAVDLLERANALTPGDPTIMEHLADAYRRASKKAQAAEAYRQAIEALRGAADDLEGKAQVPELERKLKMLSTETADR
jgi:tetratricopeptide (TPR) repeat protein